MKVGVPCYPNWPQKPINWLAVVHMCKHTLLLDFWGSLPPLLGSILPSHTPIPKAQSLTWLAADSGHGYILLQKQWSTVTVKGPFSFFLPNISHAGLTECLLLPFCLVGGERACGWPVAAIFTCLGLGAARPRHINMATAGSRGKEQRVGGPW